MTPKPYCQCEEVGKTIDMDAAPTPAEPACKGDPGECEHNGACMYACGAEPAQQDTNLFATPAMALAHGKIVELVAANGLTDAPGSRKDDFILGVVAAEKVYMDAIAAAAPQQAAATEPSEGEAERQMGIRVITDCERFAFNCGWRAALAATPKGEE